MNRIKWKLQSRKGASITFSLLIFLVCAVVSSIVIVAASTSAGRLSEMAQMDQRYYAVTSAAEMLSDLFIKHDKVEVTVDNGIAGVEDESDFVQAASKELVEKLLDDGTVASTPRDLQLTSESKPELNCGVKETIGKNGLAVFDISKTVGSGTYTLTMTLASSVQRSTATDGNAEKVTVTWKLHSIRKNYSDPEARSSGNT